MKLFKLIAAVAFGLATLVSCNPQSQPGEDVNNGFITIGERTWNNVIFLYDPANITPERIRIHFLFENQGNETANWITYVPGEEKNYQMEFQMPDSDYPLRGRIANWTGEGITKINDRQYKVDVTGKLLNDPDVNITFKGIALSKN